MPHGCRYLPPQWLFVTLSGTPFDNVFPPPARRAKPHTFISLLCPSMQTLIESASLVVIPVYCMLKACQLSFDIGSDVWLSTLFFFISLSYLLSLINAGTSACDLFCALDCPYTSQVHFSQRHPPCTTFSLQTSLFNVQPCLRFREQSLLVSKYEIEGIY